MTFSINIYLMINIDRNISINIEIDRNFYIENQTGQNKHRQGDATSTAGKMLSAHVLTELHFKIPKSSL